ncbi:ADP-ribose glycohydrolase MACROD2 isoform X1 [Sarcophilus harrisii]|uniref:ADP-ribose glycohydrolase MACROD2 isoform X1 n=1 Tax=Sarcophilus harrisii TaxID=9305 RepID=UPI001301C787|nr:ADP-ribose glycohydrolase MACROD2 isoform X1 [Sarcophilus harrisii]
MYPSNRKKKVWKEEKERLLKMTLEERRKEYLRDYVPLKDIPSWKEEMKSKSQNDDESAQEVSQVKKSLSEKVSLYRGDITLLEIDAIVNAANASLLGGGGVDGCIHRAAGPCLVAECRNLSGCETGQAKITCGYDLPAKYVIHTVGPIARGHINDSHKEDLANCYKSSLKLAKENNIRSIAFPCISTGIYGFPNEPAATIALTTIKEWLNRNHHEMDRIIFCVFLEVDFKIFKKKMSEYFPTEGLEAKGLSPPPKKSKAKKSESVKESNEDEAQPPTAPSPSSEEAVEASKDKDSTPDASIIQEDDITRGSVHDQDPTEGHDDDSMKNEMKMEIESQSSYMETEEPFSNQEDTTIVPKPEVTAATDDKEEKENEKEGAVGEGKPSAEQLGARDACPMENATYADVEMSSQDESDPTESQQDDDL